MTRLDACGMMLRAAAHWQSGHCRGGAGRRRALATASIPIQVATLPEGRAWPAGRPAGSPSSGLPHSPSLTWCCWAPRAKTTLQLYSLSSCLLSILVWNSGLSSLNLALVGMNS
jgi:hypothetical protein